MNKLQGYTVQHREDNQYFRVTTNGVKPLKTVSHYVTQLADINYTSIF